MLRIAAIIVFWMAAINGLHADELRVWQFNAVDDFEGWTVPERMRMAVNGGSLWLAPNPKETNPSVLASLNYQIYGDYNVLSRLRQGEEAKRDGPSNNGQLSIAGPVSLNIASPADLSIAIPPRGEQQLGVKVRLLNLSPVNNIDLKWRAKTDAVASWSSKRCSVRPDIKQWQTVTCYIDRQWNGTIDQIALGISENVVRGDLWVDSIQIETVDPEPSFVRPDIAKPALLPKISVPGLTQAHFEDAFKVLDECLVIDVPAYGFPYPFMKAGADGLYGDYAWPYGDTILTAASAAWVNQHFAENVLRGAAEIQAQNPDGRISGYPWEPYMGQPADNNFRPDPYFDSAHVIAMRTHDDQLRTKAYESMRKYLDWWLSPTKRHAMTGLIMGDWEEALNFEMLESSADPRAQSRAPVDLNASIVVGAELTASIASSIGKDEEATYLRQVSDELRRSINKWMWNEEDGFYYDYDIRNSRQSRKRTAQAFFTFRHGIAPESRRKRLLMQLTDPAKFNWGRTPPIVNKSRVDIDDNENAVLAFTTRPVVAGLEESGEFGLAAELNWQILQTFGRDFREHYYASGGGGGGGRYAVTAAAFIDGIIGALFGVKYDGITDSVRIAPNLPKRLYGRTLQLNGLILPTGSDTRLSIRLTQAAADRVRMLISFTGGLPKGDVEVLLPGHQKKLRLSAKRSLEVDLR